MYHLLYTDPLYIGGVILNSGAWNISVIPKHKLMQTNYIVLKIDRKYIGYLVIGMGILLIGEAYIIYNIIGKDILCKTQDLCG